MAEIRSVSLASDQGLPEIELISSITLKALESWAVSLDPVPSLGSARGGALHSPFSVAFFSTFMAYRCPLSGRVIFRTRKTWEGSR